MISAYQVCEAFEYKLLQSELWSRPLDDTVKIVFNRKILNLLHLEVTYLQSSGIKEFIGVKYALKNIPESGHTLSMY